MNQASIALIIAATAVALIFVGLLARIWVAGLRVSAGIRFLCGAIAATGAVVMGWAAAIDNVVWWLVPTAVWALLFIAAATMPVHRHIQGVLDVSHAPTGTAIPDLPLTVFESDPAPLVVDYDRFLLLHHSRGFLLVHTVTHPNCLVADLGWNNISVAAVQELAAGHECAKRDVEPDGTMLMPAVAR